MTATWNGREIRTEQVDPPIPVRCFDWQATIAGTEPDGPYGRGESEQIAICDLVEQLTDAAGVCELGRALSCGYGQDSEGNELP